MKTLLVSLIFLSIPCPKAIAGLDGATLVHQWNRTGIEVIMEDGFAPPVAARIHAYMNLAGYQAGFYADPRYTSAVGMLNEFDECPIPDLTKVYDWRVAAVAAYQVAASKLMYRIYITDSLAKVHFAELEKEVPTDVFDRSKLFGIEVGKSVNAYAKADNYARSQGLPDWEWPRCDSCWVPTPPNFAKPISPYCGNVRTIVMSGPDQFPITKNIKFSTEKGSEFWNSAFAVLEKSKTLTDEERESANFWNDNPVVTSYHGHFVFNSRQISPSGHWMNITMQVLQDEKSTMVESMEVYTLVACALFDGNTACWAEKYRSSLIRPVTYINNYIDPSWEPMLQTPPFPEHASGHSTITAAASEVLTYFFGDKPFVDDTEVPFGWKPQHFKSFRAAAWAASLSRFYGGIHYRRACDAGNEHGKKIGNNVVEKVKLKK
ncbi:MAG: vanadium-dependent haloperoxidase [Ignavibacteria bacterium]|nr:vanadium-dependent haloperoxidase [Ignavibacteria bacterium]